MNVTLKLFLSEIQNFKFFWSLEKVGPERVKSSGQYFERFKFSVLFYDFLSTYLVPTVHVYSTSVQDFPYSYDVTFWRRLM